MLGEETSLEQAKASWKKAAIERGPLDPQCIKEDLDQEVNWIENTVLTQKLVRTPRSH
jgi:hypothetical protein